MPNRYRLYLRAIGGCLAAFLLVSGLCAQEAAPDGLTNAIGEDSDTNAKNGDTGPKEGSRPSEAKTAATEVTRDSSVHTPVAEKKTEKRSRYPNCEFSSVEECNLAAQQSMAESTVWMNRAAWAGIALTILGLFLLWRTMRYTKNAAEGAAEAVVVGRETLVATQRPWLSVTVSLASNLQIKNREGRIDVLFEMKNHGISPATGVHIDAEFIDMFPMANSSNEHRSRLLKNAQSGSAQKHGLLGYQIFPGDTIKVMYSMPVRKGNDLPDGAAGTDHFNSTLIAFISYTSKFTEDVLITEVRKTLGQVRDDAPRAFVGIKIEDGVIPQSRLVFTSTLGDGGLR